MKPPAVRAPSHQFLIIKVLFLGLIIIWLAGCTTTSAKEFWTSGDGVPRKMEADYGLSVNHNRMEMMLTPPDAVDTKPAVGLTPQAAKNAQDRYDKSFKEREEPPSLKVMMK